MTDKILDVLSGIGLIISFFVITIFLRLAFVVDTIKYAVFAQKDLTDKQKLFNEHLERLIDIIYAYPKDSFKWIELKSLVLNALHDMHEKNEWIDRVFIQIDKVNQDNGGNYVFGKYKMVKAFEIRNIISRAKFRPAVKPESSDYDLVWR